MTATTYMMGNLKGGVSKTTITTMLAFQTSVFNGKKTLVIDMDPSPGATKLLAKTAKVYEINKSISTGFLEGDLTSQVMPILENLDLIPGDEGFAELTRLISSKFPSDLTAQYSYLSTLLEPLKDSYDYIFIDLPPSQYDYHRNAILASDYCILPLHIQDPSIDAADQYIRLIRTMVESHNASIELGGIVPVSTARDSKEEASALEYLRETYGDALTDTVVVQRERIRKFAREGIASPEKAPNDYWVKNAHQIFKELWEDITEG